jgi:hypothetical protein
MHIGQALIVGNVFRDERASLYTGIDAFGSESYQGAARVDLLHNVIHADEVTRAVAVRAAQWADIAAINNVLWLQTLGSAVELAGTVNSLELYHNDMLAPPGRCLLETARAAGFCALDVDDVNACKANGLCAGVGGNLSAPPRFVDPAAGDYHLQASSPLIDRGYDLVAGDGLAGLDRAGGPLGAVSLYSAGVGAVDVDRELRTPARRWDIGIDER